MPPAQPWVAAGIDTPITLVSCAMAAVPMAIAAVPASIVFK